MAATKAPVRTQRPPEYYRSKRQRLATDEAVKKRHAPTTKVNMHGVKLKWTSSEALAEDKLNGQYVPESIKEMDFGDRSTAYQGPIPLADVLSSELKQRRHGSKTVISGTYAHYKKQTLTNLSSLYVRCYAGRLSRVA
ncbi:hypothetical protein ISF_09791 [Cordyceps fumosorosea ARSEF 2679]|uniref:Uncharacterized protein n=1 Tax=Cordyceps fumosorosea (strain ARSEF 2679) TaxID=1081104 RepID=A0A167C8M4_CORFA|nr:hypothetical protein ISF_09791 [Cordyceps fumosorosea ARSEF 2679]OAA40902.1 hypothetical protein ISF_09791 [Cordyceps fumosorosea ARSEF 2679]